MSDSENSLKVESSSSPAEIEGSDLNAPGDASAEGEAAALAGSVQLFGQTVSVEKKEAVESSSESKKVEEVKAVDSGMVETASAEDGEPAATEEASEGEAAGEESEEDEAPKVLKDLDPERAALPWYVVHTYSGFEMQVKASLEERIKTKKLEKRFGNILVPQETVVELVRGQKKTSTRKFLPGYIVVQMHLDDETWHFVGDTPKVTGFVGDSRNPMPLSKKEVENLVTQIEGGGQRPKPKVHFEEGDSIKVIDGPFADFNGTVDEVKPDKGKLRVLISIFGRNTPVELDFVQVEKA